MAAWMLDAAACANMELSALTERIDALGVDVLAFQEVENAAAAERVLGAIRDRRPLRTLLPAATPAAPPANNSR